MMIIFSIYSSTDFYKGLQGVPWNVCDQWNYFQIQVPLYRAKQLVPTVPWRCTIIPSFFLLFLLLFSLLFLSPFSSLLFFCSFLFSFFPFSVSSSSFHVIIGLVICRDARPVHRRVYVCVLIAALLTLSLQRHSRHILETIWVNQSSGRHGLIGVFKVIDTGLI